ncbi:MAG: hypothetical protein PHY43_00555 [Verrucomicrobiales bacterium]|nr:hypothetical protein [Verrucomicrobiales bacterium]
MINYAKPIVAELRANMVRVDADFSATPFKAKISNAEQLRVHTMLVTRRRFALARQRRRSRHGSRRSERAPPPRRPARREAERRKSSRIFWRASKSAGLELVLTLPGEELTPASVFRGWHGYLDVLRNLGSNPKVNPNKQFYARSAAIWCAAVLGLSGIGPSIQGAGVTVITHGFNSDIASWITPMAGKITAYENFPGTNSTCYKLSITKSGSTYTATPSLIAGVPPLTSDSGEIIIKVDWSTIDTTLGVSTANIANAAAAALQSTNLLPELGGRALVELPLHLIGHSRGGSVVTEMARFLGAQGIWVDQVTTLDPDPVPLYGDPAIKNYANVLFADNYWQNMGDGLTVPNGQAVSGAYNRHLTNLNGGYSSSHSDVHLWYHGTIQLETPASDTQANITSAERLAWWTADEASGTNAGFYYSLIGGGDRFSEAEPAGAGTGQIRGGCNQVWDLGAGSTPNRNNLPADNGAWPNILRLNLTGTNHFSVDSPLPIAFYDQFGSNTSPVATVRFFLDPDSNPFDANEITLGQFSINGTGTNAVAFNNENLVLDPVVTPPGTYFLFASISDGLHARYLYAPEILTLDPSRQAPSLLAPHIQNDQLRFTISGFPGQMVIVQASTNLVMWGPVATNQLTGTTIDFSDASGTGLPQRFYRALLSP